MKLTKINNVVKIETFKETEVKDFKWEDEKIVYKRCGFLFMNKKKVIKEAGWVYFYKGEFISYPGGYLEETKKSDNLQELVKYANNTQNQNYKCSDNKVFDKAKIKIEYLEGEILIHETIYYESDKEMEKEINSIIKKHGDEFLILND